ncbi:hypothetical protein HAX54_037042 [Datura stramonium]|uniref:Uncharacterized protein n=1 Tax=Datura stramonium TaxID=4076 RepID=A0ABS8VKJ1_DATST|nr:hypothetical protein [Datura stramonium]
MKLGSKSTSKIYQVSLKGNEGLSFILVVVDLLSEVVIECNFEKAPGIDGTILISIERAGKNIESQLVYPNKYDAYENVETELVVDESVKSGVPLDENVEVVEDLQVFSYAAEMQDAPLQMRVVSGTEKFISS